MSTADLRKIGSVSLLDVDIINALYGHDFLPYPFMFTQPSRFSWHDQHDQYEKYERSVPERFNSGDLAMYQPLALAYVNADIRVECHVQYIPADTPSVRVLAVRSDQLGFLAKQRPDEDVIDVYKLSPYSLGPAVADAVALEKPGRRAGIIIPEFVRVSNNAGASAARTVRRTTIKVPYAEVTAFGTVQTHWRPTRHSGIDPSKKFAAWVRIKDDGEYLYKPGSNQATPVTRAILAERIDRLISEDIKALREFRGE